jgi:phosphatidylglycerophosphate synthase
LLLLAAAGVQFRLLCNLLDGMVAVEVGRKTKGGEVFNELPDRASDVVLLVCAGYASAAAVGPAWAAALG